MITIDAIELANKNAGITSSSLADLQEVNAFIDSFRFDKFPINIVAPLDSNGTTINGIRRAVIPLKGWILTRVREDTNDYRSLAMEREYIDPMRKLAIKFLMRLYETEIVDPQAVERGITDSIKPEYRFLNLQAFGVSYTVNLPVIERVC